MLGSLSRAINHVTGGRRKLRVQVYEVGARYVCGTPFAFYFRKRWMGGINLDGMDDWPLDIGNIWFIGIFEV